MNILRRILSGTIICISACVLSCGVLHAADTNLPTSGTVGDYGSWATEENLDMVSESLGSDITALEDAFNKTQMASNYVPIEARVGLAFMNAMSWLGIVLDNSLVRFTVIFIILGFIFWIMLETYVMMTKGDGNIKKLAEDIVKKGALIAIWIIVLDMGPAKIFMWVMGPILALGTTISNFVLNAVTSLAGASLPDTCTAIHSYAAANTNANMLIDANMAADIVCLPTRLSGLFLTAISVGFSWMYIGIGTSLFTFLIGAVFVVLFAVNMWKFALMALGVIADLFMGIFMLPFTAIAETLGKTSYKGIAGNIFNGFLALFKVESLSSQIARFVNATIYFVSLSIIIAICAVLLSGTVTPALSNQIPSLADENYMTILLTGCLVLYLASVSDKLAKQLGGAVDGAMGQQFGKDVVGLAKSGYKNVAGWVKVFRKK